MRHLIAAALLGVSALAAHAQSGAIQSPVAQVPAAEGRTAGGRATGVPAVEASRPWARPTAPRQETGAAYVDLRSAAGDRLVRASTPAAARVEVHETRMDGDVMRMREVPALDLPPGRTVALAPGGHHLMLVGLKERLMPGQHFPLRLEFDRAAPLDVTVVVAQAGAGGSTGPHTGHGHR